jgi:hypothetical protein
MCWPRGRGSRAWSSVATPPGRPARPPRVRPLIRRRHAHQGDRIVATSARGRTRSGDRCLRAAREQLHSLVASSAICRLEQILGSHSRAQSVRNLDELDATGTASRGDKRTRRHRYPRIAHSAGGRKVAGSNPVAPISSTPFRARNIGYPEPGTPRRRNQHSRAGCWDWVSTGLRGLPHVRPRCLRPLALPRPTRSASMPRPPTAPARSTKTSTCRVRSRTPPPAQRTARSVSAPASTARIRCSTPPPPAPRDETGASRRGRVATRDTRGS